MVIISTPCSVTPRFSNFSSVFGFWIYYGEFLARLKVTLERDMSLNRANRNSGSRPPASP